MGSGFFKPKYLSVIFLESVKPGFSDMYSILRHFVCLSSLKNVPDVSKCFSKTTMNSKDNDGKKRSASFREGQKYATYLANSYKTAVFIL